MRLHIGELAAEQSGRPFDRQALGDIYELAAAVIALSWQSLSIFVGEHRPLCLQNRARNDVLRGNQLDFVALPAQFQVDRLCDLRVDLAQSCVEKGFRITRWRGLRRRRHHDLLAPGARPALRKKSGIRSAISTSAADRQALGWIPSTDRNI